MPANFADLATLRRAFDAPAGVPYQGEPEAEYRARCAAWSAARGDRVQAQEVRLGKGWDQWTVAETLAAMRR
jgi:hypothetical protein